jgi:hypothetical protein
LPNKGCGAHWHHQKLSLSSYNFDSMENILAAVAAAVAVAAVVVVVVGRRLEYVGRISLAESDNTAELGQVDIPDKEMQPIDEILL